MITLEPHTLPADPSERAWIHTHTQHRDHPGEVVALIRDQSGHVARDCPPDCAACDRPPVRAWRSLYRCVVCDLWFCGPCAQKHNNNLTPPGDSP